MINFDNAATAGEYGNPNSPHAFGIQSERLVMSSAEKMALIIGCKTDEVVFTSGGTESNNLALLGMAEALQKRGGTILTTSYEHPSVLEPLRYLKAKGYFKLVECPIMEWGDRVLTEGAAGDVVLASFTQVNHETGDVNDIETIASMLKKINPRIITHVDGAQGFCKSYMPSANVDLYSFSAHKFGGPSGMGGLVVRRGVPLKPLMYGGGQQFSLRPGTLNVPGIIKMTEAAEASWNERHTLKAQTERVKVILSGLAEELPDVFINSVLNKVSPFILNMSFMGIKGETLVHMLSGRGIYASMGAACRSGKKDISPLELMGYDKERADAAVRFSFWRNSEDEAEKAKAEIIKCVTELRSVKRKNK